MGKFCSILAETIWAMETFASLPLGTFALDLADGSSEAETIPGSPDRVSSSSIATTIEIIELTDSDTSSSEVEVVEGKVLLLTPENARFSC